MEAQKPAAQARRALKVPARRAIIRAVASSTAIETGKSIEQIERILRDKRSKYRKDRAGPLSRRVPDCQGFFPRFVIPAKAGIQRLYDKSRRWVPAFTGTTRVGDSGRATSTQMSGQTYKVG